MDSFPAAQGSGSDEHGPRDQFVASLTEILKTAASESTRDRVSALRKLAAAAEELAETLDPG